VLSIFSGGVFLNLSIVSGLSFPPAPSYYPTEMQMPQPIFTVGTKPPRHFLPPPSPRLFSFVVFQCKTLPLPKKFERLDKSPRKFPAESCSVGSLDSALPPSIFLAPVRSSTMNMLAT